MAWTLLRPTGFMQNTLAWGPRVLDGTFYSPVPDAAFSIVDARDVAEVAAVALTEEGHEGKAYGLSGPEAVSFRDQARRVFAAAGREVKVEEIELETLKRELVRAGVPPWNAEGLSRAVRDVRERRRADGHVRRQGRAGPRPAQPRRVRQGPRRVVQGGRAMIDGGAWGAGLATFSGDRILEVFYPEPRLGEHDGSGTRELSAERPPSTGCRPRSAPTIAAARARPGHHRDRGPRRSRRTAPPTPTCACTCSRTGSSSRTTSTSTASSARCRTSPGRAPARSTRRT